MSDEEKNLVLDSGVNEGTPLSYEDLLGPRPSVTVGRFKLIWHVEDRSIRIETPDDHEDLGERATLRLANFLAGLVHTEAEKRVEEKVRYWINTLHDEEDIRKKLQCCVNCRHSSLDIDGFACSLTDGMAPYGPEDFGECLFWKMYEVVKEER